MDFAVLNQVGGVQARLQVHHLAGQKSVLAGLSGQGIAAISGQKSRKPRLLQGQGPRLGQVVCAAFAGVFFQNQTRPIECPNQNPGGLGAGALGSFNFHRTPLLPQRGRGHSGHQNDREHGHHNRSALLCLAFHGGVLPSVRAQSRVSTPLIAWSAGKVRTNRTPSGKALASVAEADDWGFVQALLRK